MNKFEPDYTPIEMIKMGVFGGSYFHYKPLKKSIFHWRNHVPKRFIHDINREICPLILFTPKVNDVYDKEVNHYKVDCGTSYEDWKMCGWIVNIDPYGWFNWYINYYYGRRCSDDERQITRWLNFKSRNTGMINKYPNSAKIKQNLLHWGINYENLII